MPKKTKTTDETIRNEETSGFLEEIQFFNFTLFGKNKLEFRNGVNILIYTSDIDKIVFNYILTCSLNPQFMAKHKFIDQLHFTHLRDIQIDSKKNFSFVMTLNLHNQFADKKNDFFVTFVAQEKILVEVEVSKTKEITRKLFDNNQKSFVKLSPTQEFNFYNVVYQTFWIDSSFFPFYNLKNQIEVMNFNKSKMFDFIVSHLNLNQIKTQIFGLKERINLGSLESENLTNLKAQSEERRNSIEQEIQLLEKVDEIDKKLNEFELENEWSRYFELKNKFEGKVSNIEQNRASLLKNQSEKESLETQQSEITATLNEMKIQLEAITQDYDNKRQNFLTEKAHLDRIDRNLKDWSSSVNKVEKEIKFKTMKLKDKEKKLKDLESRIAKGSTDALLDQKTKLENEIKKDKSGLVNLQENLDAVRNEQQLKSKEKNIKEKNSQPANTELAKIASQMSDLTQKIYETEKESESLKQKLQNNQISTEKIQNSLNALEKEIKELNKEIQRESEQIKAKSLPKPKENRSSGTIRVLQNQLINDKKQLLRRINSETTKETLTEYIDFMEKLDSEISERNSQLTQFKKELLALEETWQNIFSKDLNRLLELTNDLLGGFKLKIEVEKSESTLPDEGALVIRYYFNELEAKQLYQLSELIIPSFIVFNALLLSLILLNKTGFFVFDVFDLVQIPKDQLEELLEKFSKKKTEKSESKIILVHHRKQSFSSDELQNLIITN